MASTLCFILLLGNFFVLGYGACPRIVSRSEWGARAPKSSPTKLAVPVTYAVVHHGATNTKCTTQSSCAQIVRSYQNYHMDTNGWADIGYNFLVGEDGNAYEGRGWDAVGVHAGEYNWNSIGICIIGDFTGRLPNQAALKTLKDLIACGVEKSKIKSNYELKGHRQVGSTTCPGNKLYEEIKNWPKWTP